MRRRIAGLAGASLLLVCAATASAHGDRGAMTITRAEQTGPTAITLEVGLVYENDNELAENAVVHADVTGSSGERVGPVSLPRISGARYGAVIDLPTAGHWTVIVSSEGPAAEARTTVVVSDRSPQSSTTATAPSPADDTDTKNTDNGEGGDDGSNGPLVAGVVIAALVAGGVILLISRR